MAISKENEALIESFLNRVRLEILYNIGHGMTEFRAEVTGELSNDPVHESYARSFHLNLTTETDD